MLTIRDAQLAALGDVPREEFRQRLAMFLSTTFPEHVGRLADSDYKRFLAEAEKRANHHGVLTQRGMVQWVAIALLAGLEFDEMPAVAAVMSDIPLRPDSRVELLFRALCSLASRGD